MSDESTIRIDWKSCDARGLCAELVPELIKLDEWGYPIVQPGVVPKPLMGHVKRAAAACPTLAVHVIKTPKP
ncbi:MAG: ferredoxin [Actinomycetota bacterium]|nr:ferredoxin [Actinomycetota bacterium]